MAYPKGKPLPAGAGRKPGTPNRVTTDTRRMILDALDAEGGIDYLRKLARNDPRTFAQLVRAVLPREFKVDAGATFEDILLASFNRPRPAPPAPTAQPGPPAAPPAAP